MFEFSLKITSNYPFGVLIRTTANASYGGPYYIYAEYCISMLSTTCYGSLGVCNNYF